MFKNYLKIAMRNLVKHKGYSFINIVGLAIGLACCFLIILYLRHELSYDRFHERSPRIYRLLLASVQDPGGRSAVTASGYAPHLLHEFPEIEQAVRFFTSIGSANLRYGAEARSVSGFVFADGPVFEVFSFKLRQGNPQTALQSPQTMVITASAAQAWFGSEDPIGKTITYLRDNQKIGLEITGVLEDLPGNSHLRFDYLVSFSTLRNFMGENALAEYTNFNYYTYLLLKAGSSPEQLLPRFPEFLRKYRGEEVAAAQLLVLQPLLDIHLTTNVRWETGANTDKKYLYIFSAVAALVLLIAIINFVNLATARAALRAREVGVRKVVGAQRRQLIQQLFGESILASVLAMGLALILLQLVAPVAGKLIGREIAAGVFREPALLLMLLAVGLLSGILAGIYPAIVLSAYDPVTVIKGLITRGMRGARLRRTLIVAQFGISVFLLMAMATVYYQLHFMKTRNLGFDKEHVLLVSLSGAVREHFAAFRSNLLGHAKVQNVALSTVPGRVGTSRTYNWPGIEHENGRDFYTMFVDPDAVAALGLELVEGRNFSAETPTDVTNAYILNETAVHELEWDNPIGKPFRVWDEEMGQVIGVIKDFHYQSLHQKIEPLVLDIKPEWSSTAAIRIAPVNIRSVLEAVEAEWKALEPEVPFNFRFLDADFDRLYRSEERLGRLFSSFTFLAIFVACLGLFGLAAFTVQQRTKEIGIRKVLGASVNSILLLLSKEFAKLVALAFVIAAPMAYFAMAVWLENFAYRTSPGAGLFLLCGVFVLVLALLTVSYQAVKTALANPVQSLRYE